MATMLETAKTVPSLLELRQLCLTRGDTIIADNMDLALRPGDRRALLGGNGVGKSTLLAAMAGVLRADRKAIHRGGRIHFVSQHLALEPVFTVRQQLSLTRRSMDESDPAIAAMQLGGILDTPVRRLSVGQRQLVGLVQALSSDADVLLLDEPTASLDPHFREVFWQVCAKHLRPECCVLFVTHSAVEAVDRATSACVLRDGKLHEQPVGFDPADRVMRFSQPLEKTAEAAFLGVSGISRVDSLTWLAKGGNTVQSGLSLIAQHKLPLSEVVPVRERVIRTLSEEAGCAL